MSHGKKVSLRAAPVSFTSLSSFLPRFASFRFAALRSTRHPFTKSGSVHPLPIFCARRPPYLGCVHLASIRLIPSVHSPMAAKVHLHSSAPFVSACRRKFTPGASYGAGHRPGRPGLPVQPLCGGSPSASVTSFLLTPAAVVNRLAIALKIGFRVPNILRLYHFTVGKMGGS